MRIRWLALLMLFFAACAQSAPQIQNWVTGNGARVYFVPAHELPMVDIRVVFDAGSARDGQLNGLAKLTNGMFSEGAAGLDADAIAERFARLGAQLSNSSARDMASVGLRSLRGPASLDPAAALLADLIARPDFPADALERLRQQMLVGLRRGRQSPGTIAQRAFYRELYPDHPYGNPPAGEDAGVEAITGEDISAFHKQFYVGANAVVAVVGDLSRAHAERLVDSVVGDLPSGQAAPVLPPVPRSGGSRDRSVSHPSTQAHILMGQPGMSRLDADFYPLYVGNHILGGSGLVSRLNDTIREQRGLAYSVYSYFVPMRVAGPYIVGMQTGSKNTATALSLLREEVARFVAKGPSEEELDDAKRNITGGFPLRIASNSKILGYLGLIGFYRLPLDYLQRFNERVMAVTRAQVNDAFQRRVDPASLITVVLGPATAAADAGQAR